MEEAFFARQQSRNQEKRRKKRRYGDDGEQGDFFLITQFFLLGSQETRIKKGSAVYRASARESSCIPVQEGRLLHGFVAFPMMGFIVFLLQEENDGLSR
jgi:hypothetical protein